MTPLESAIAAINNFPNAGERDALVAAKCRGLMHGYDRAWSNAGYVALEVERAYKSLLYNPTSAGRSRSFEVAGKIDVYAELHGRRFCFDHKTTTQDISDPNAPYWRQLVVEGQATHYLYLLWLNAIKADGAVWDVVRKPGISPKKLSKAERALAVADRKYFGRFLSAETLTWLQIEERESLEMYESRLIHDCSVERPEWYFQRRPVPRLDAQLIEYAEDLWQHGKDILASRRIERLPMNSGACMLYGSPCKFLGICSGHDSVNSDHWSKRALRHQELGPEHGTMDALTNSRIRCFQTCRVKHRFEYELCLERQDEEEKESLWFGTLFHEGQAAWWRCFLKEEPDSHGHCNSSTETVNAQQWNTSQAADAC